MQRVGVIYNPFSEEATRFSVEVSGWLRGQGVDVWCGVSREGRESHGQFEQLDLLVALGGDGTVLRAARLAIPHGIPVLPVAMGHLSFMSDLGPKDLFDGLLTLFAGGGWRDERSLIEMTLERQDLPPLEDLALNEVLLTRGPIPRVVVVDALVDDALLMTYHADGVMVATATGSTAYALAAGGPIIDPRSNALVLVTVAPHLTNVPSMVLHEDADVRLVLRSRHVAAVAVDGRDTYVLHEGDTVRVRRSSFRCIFARLHPPSRFYASLSAKLQRG